MYAYQHRYVVSEFDSRPDSASFRPQLGKRASERRREKKKIAFGEVEIYRETRHAYVCAGENIVCTAVRIRLIDDPRDKSAVLRADASTRELTFSAARYILLLALLARCHKLMATSLRCKRGRSASSRIERIAIQALSAQRFRRNLAYRHRKPNIIYIL